MSNQRSDDSGRPVGELWVELSRDEKNKICDSLIDRNQADVMQEFATLVRFTHGYLRQQPTKDKPVARKRRAASYDDFYDEVVKDEKVEEDDGRI